MTDDQPPVFTGDRDQEPRDYKTMSGTYDGAAGGIHSHRTNRGGKYRHQHQWWAQPHTHERDHR